MHNTYILLNNLANELEGDLFVEIFLSCFQGQFSIHKNHYTIKDGLVYMVNDGRFDSTQDSVLDVHSRCKKLGKYDSSKKYKRIIKDYTYADLKKLHKL